ncbi:MAG: inverse autotransporter beta domain-containing protein [Planctomycetaceae bacterium]
MIKTLRARTALFAGFCALVCCLLQNTSAWAQPGTFDPGVDGYTEDFSGSVSLGNNGTYLMIDQNIGDRLGGQDGFFRGNIFTPLFQRDPDNLIFGAANLLVSDHTRVGAVGTLGYRRFLPDYGRILGVHGSLFTDDSMTGNRYQQFSFGAEWLGDTWDLRSNIYIPTNRQDNRLGIVEQGTTPVFRNGQLVVLNQRAFEEQLTGGDLEVGVPIPTQSWIKAFLGTYYYDTTEPADIVGVSGRVTAQVSTDMNLYIGVTEDKRFGTNLTGGVAIAFSGGTGYQYFPTRTVDQRMFDQVVQNYRIATNVYTAEEEAPVIDPDTGRPFDIIWVDNSNPNPGDGSFENPFQSIHEKICSSIIFVRNGTTSAGNPLVSEFFLCDDQRLLGEGLPHVIFGTVIDVPGVAIAGPNPWVTTGAGGDIVTLANRNEVAGFNFIAPAGGTAITNTFAIQNTNINNVHVTGSGSGIDLRNIRGVANISTSTFDLSGAPFPGAISIVNNIQPPLNLNLDSVDISGGVNGVRLSAVGSQINTLINSVTVDGSGTGLALSAAANGQINITMNDSNFINSTGIGVAEGDGIAATVSSGGRVLIDATNTGLSDNLDNALGIATFSGGRFNAVFNGGDLSGSGDNGIEFLADDSLNNSLIMTNVDVSGSGADGLHAAINNVSTLLIDITNGNFDNAGGDAIDVSADNGSALAITVDPTPGMNAGANGMLLRALGGSRITGSFEDVDFSGANDDGVHVDVIGVDSIANLTFDNFDFSDTVTDDGFDFIVNGGEMNATFTNGFFNNAGDDGIRGLVANSAVARLFVTDVDVENATNFAFCVDVLNNSAFTGVFTNVSFANAGMGPVCINVDGGSTATTIFDNVDFGPGGADCAIEFLVQGGSTYNVSVFNSNMSNFLSAVCGEVFDTGSSATVTLEDVFADNSTASGIDVSADEGEITINTANVSLDNSGVDGIQMTLTNGAAGDLNIADTSIENSERHGLFVDAANSTMQNSFVTNSSLDNSGAGGAGHAIFFDLDNSDVPLFSMINTSAENAADDGLFVNALNGSSFTGDISGGSFDNAGDNAIHANLVDNSIVTIQTDGTSAEGAGMNGVLFTATLGSTVNGDFQNGSFDNAGLNAVHIDLDNSDGTLFMDNMTGANAGLNGFFADLDNGSELISTVNNGSFSDNGGNAIRLLLDNASSATTVFSNTPGENSVNDGMFMNVDNGSDLTASVIGGSFNNSGLNAVVGTIDTNSLLNLSLANTTGDNAQEGGIFITATNNSALNLTTLGGSFDNVGQNGAAANRNGLNLDFDNSDAQLDMDGTTFENAPANGALLVFDNGSTLGTALAAASIANGSFDGAGEDAVRILIDNVSTGFLDLTATTGNNAGVDGIFANIDNASELTLGVNAGSFENAGNDGMQFNVDNASTFNAEVVATSFNTAGNNGIIGDIDNLSSVELLLTGTTADDAGANAFFITENNGSDFTGIVTGGSFTNAGLNGLGFDIDDSTAAFALNGAPANNAGENGLFFELTNGAVFGTALQPVAILNSNFDNSGINAVRGLVDTGSTGALTMDNTSGVESGFDGLHLELDGASDLIVDIANGSFADSGQDGVSPLTERNAINLDVTGVSNLDITLTNVDANNTAGNVTQENGMLFDVDAASTLTGNISSTILGAPSNYSNNNVNAVQGVVTGAGSSVDLLFDGVTADESGEEGFNIAVSNLATLDLDVLGSVNPSSISNSGGDGMLITVAGNGALSDTTASVTLDNTFIDENGQDALLGGDGVDISGANGGAIDLTTAGGSVSRNRDVGIRIAVVDELSPFTLNMNGTAVNANENGEGLLASVINGGLFNATIVDGSFSGNGVSTPASGFKTTVSGTNGFGVPSTANISFEGTELSDNTIHGLELLANLGAELNVSLDDVTISNNRFSGVSMGVFNADTVATFTMTGDNLIDLNGDTTDFDGIDIDINGAQSASISIAGTIQANGNNGVDINAVNTTIDALSITGNIIENGTFPAGQGDGVNISLDNVLVNAFSVLNANVDENTGGGLVLSAANGSLINNGIVTLSSFSENTGGSGLTIDLTDSDAPNFQIVSNTNISANDENGIVIRLNNSPLTGLTISDNFNLDGANLIEGISGNGLNGILFDINDSKLTDLVVDDNFIDDNNGGDGINFTDTDSDIEGMISGNTITNNSGNGIGIANLVSTAPTMTIDFGTIASNRYILSNEISGNDGAGIFVDLDDNMNFLGQLGGNTFDDNNVGFRLRAHGDATFTTEFGNALMPVVANTFNNNSDAGIAYELTRQFLGDNVDVVGNVTISEVTITNTIDGGIPVLDGSGIHIRMNDLARLNTAIIDNNNAVIGGNAADGVTIEIAEDAALPDLQILNTQVTGNGAHGVNINRFDRSEIVALIENVQGTTNTLNGFNLFATNRQTPELEFTFNDNTFNDNGRDGMAFETAADAVVRLTGDRNITDSNTRHGMSFLTGEDSAIGNPITTARSVFNNSLITNNSVDGVNVQADNNSRVLLDFRSPVDPMATDRTQITGNANNGLTVTGNGTSGVDFVLHGTDVTGNLNDGFNSTANGDSLVELTIGGVGAGEENVISENGGAGIDLTGNGTSLMLVNATENIINFNGDDGVSVILNSFADFDGELNDNTINNNSGRGFDYTATFFNGSRGSPIEILLSGNTINTNDLEGVRVVTDANFNQNREVLLPNAGFPSDNRPFPVDPSDPVFLATAGYDENFRNLFVTQATNMVVTNNTIRDNGNGVDSHGILLQIGTGTYLSADVQNNVFGGNVLSDFRTEGFASQGSPSQSVDRSGATTFDSIFLDDTAQLDLRFNLNTGDQIEPTARTAGGDRFAYDFDPGKNGFPPNFYFNPPRSTPFLFQVDDGPNLDFPNNDFIQFGVQQDIDGAFSGGGYNLRSIADPLFPNPAFPPFLP